MTDKAQAADSANHYHSFVRGFRHGAAGKVPDGRHLNHATLRQPYLDGFDRGQLAMDGAAKTARARYGFTPSILRGPVVSATKAPDGATPSEQVHVGKSTREPCPMCSRPIRSVRNAVAETDLPADTSSADAIRLLWSRLTSPSPERPKYRMSQAGRLECSEHAGKFTQGCWPCLETVVAVPEAGPS